MKHPSLSATHALYLCGSYCQIYYHSVSFPLLHQFSLAVRELEQAIGDEVQDEYWQAVLKEIKHYRFALVAAPLPVNWSGQHMLSFLHREARQCSYLYPHYVSYLEAIIELLHTVSACNDNPLLDALLPLTRGSTGSSVVLLLNGTHLHPFFDEVRTTVPALREIELVNIYQLKETVCYDQLIVVGRCRWYPEYIFRAPRAEQIHFVRYSWMQDTWKPHLLFQATLRRQPLPERQNRDESVPDQPASLSENLEDEIELPPIEWEAISADMLQQTTGEHDQEKGPARLCLLADGYAVLLDISEQSQVLVLDLEDEEYPSEEESESQAVKYLEVRDLRPGMFLLLRTGGGGDSLISIADQLLGEPAQRMRSLQKLWKQRLLASVAAKDLFEVSLELIDHGSYLANESNLSHWMSERSIHPHEYRDFLAIMRLIGMEAEAEAYWANAQHIEMAHRRAGFHIRKRLLAHVTHADLSKLRQTGRMDFELAEMGASSLSAFRIEQMSPETFLIPLARLGRLYSTRRLSWLE